MIVMGSLWRERAGRGPPSKKHEMTRGLEKALAAVRHDNKPTVMSAAEIEAHRVFLAGLGIARQEIDLTINVIHSTLRGDEVAMPEYIIPLMPATWVGAPWESLQYYPLRDFWRDGKRMISA